ncbi:hypothetical protein ACIA8O_03455 [Kitasatospora sp. NPDC051853]|uniref:hypothetical protein n=1 Tax=Kitasatospora sp. NPDC051853 TaxID=3364058 RepID=UPI0037AA6D15
MGRRPPGNELLYAARISKGWFSQEAAAAGISTAGQRVLASRGFQVNVRTYRRWEAPAPPWPRPDHASALRAAFDRGPEALGFVARGGPAVLAPVVTIGGAGTGAVDSYGTDDFDTEDQHGPVNRRQALRTVGTAALGGLPWLDASPVAAQGGARIGRDEIEELRATALDLDAIDQRFGGDLLWRSARAQLLRVHDLIDHATYGEQAGRELHDIAGQLTTSLGWFCYDAERQTEARVYFSEALNTAVLSGNDPLATRTLANMARQSVDLGKPREAVRYARIAQAHAAEWSAPPRVAALLAIREAQGYGRLGNETACAAAIRRAWQAFGRGTTERDPDWVRFLNEAELVCLEGMCRLDLGHYRQAVRLLERSAQLQHIAHSRNRGMCLARLSYAALQDRDVDRTVAAAQESLRLIEGGMASARNKRQLSLVREKLTAHQALAEVRETTERLAVYTA